MDVPVMEIPPWSRDKLELLRKYLHAHSTIMNKQKSEWLRSYSYVDAFAGVGQYVDRDSQEYVDGSPVVALRCEPPFDDYWFIERSPGRLLSLSQRVQADFPNRVVHFEQGDANTVLVRQVAQTITYAQRMRGFVFLDPYGLEVHFGTLESLGKARAFDMFINFSVMGVARILDRDQGPDAQTRQLLDRIMGDSQWVDDIYARQMDLFGEEHLQRGTLAALSIARRYMDSVKQLFPKVSEPVLMRNSRNAPLYVLFLASHNATAVKITNDMFKRYERLRSPGS
ncbi:MAG: three-Cys-motif partner protein TcmP [Chloroflexi bacterium]|nr:three-Cys-motif partner protein TcmP [Chloroflexota bacterium]